MVLKELLVKSKEGKVILENFASRQRIHKDKHLDIKRLYFVLSRQHPGMLSMPRFEQVFKDLVTMGYGIIEGRYFVPEESIKAIGQDALPEMQSKSIEKPIKSAVLVTPKMQEDKVVVLFKLNGLRCRAEIPSGVLPLFEKLVNL
jgi:hypothetical protein